MHIIRYHIQLEEPIVVTALDGDPNSAVSFDYLPGSVLRGMVISLYRLKYGLPKDFSTNLITRRLFLEPSTRYLNGYLFDNVARTLPTPVSWQRPKNSLQPIFDFVYSDQPQADCRALRSPFCQLNGDTIFLYQPSRVLNVHINREDRYAGRPTLDGKGTVYRYEALAKEQTFEAFIICENAEDAQKLRDLLDGTAKIGGAKSAGYGGVRLQAQPDVKAKWRECGKQLHYAPSTPIILTFLSPVLLRDRYGQHVVDKKAIGDALHPYLAGVKVENAFLRSTLIGGFNTRWGLPLPQTLAVSMGSVLVLSGAGITEQQLLHLEQYGIGERRSEGFGRVAVNWQTVAEYNNVTEKEITSTEIIPSLKPQELSPTSAALARDMAKRLLERELEQRILAAANKVEIVNPPARAQLYRLRQKIVTGLNSSSMQPLDEHITSIEKRQVARRAFSSAYVDGQPFLIWLRQQGNFELHDLSKAIAGQEITLTTEQQTASVLRFLDVVLAKATKQTNRGN